MYLGARLLSTSSKSRLTNFQNKLSDNVLFGFNQLKGNLIQAMAHRMNEKDKAEMIQYWGDDETIQTSGTERESAVAAAPRVLPSTDLRAIDQATEENILLHPVLGEKLADLGYKTLYLTNIRSLAMAPIWKKQRILRPERAQLIANDKIKNNLGSSLSGTIAFFHDKKTKEIGIIDGQHRAGALMVLAQKGHWNEQIRNILVEVYSTSSQAQIGALFREINAAEPVRLVDLLMQEESPAAEEKEGDSAPVMSSSNTNSTIASSTMEKTASAESVELAKEAANTDVAVELSQEELVSILDSAADRLAAHYPEMFKPSSRCKPPHLNADVLRDDLFQSDFLPRHDVRSAEDLLALLDRVNASIKLQLSQGGVAEASQSKSQQAAAKKAAEFDFFLGLDKAWMYATHAPPVSTPKAKAKAKGKN